MFTIKNDFKIVSLYTVKTQILFQRKINLFALNSIGQIDFQNLPESLHRAGTLPRQNRY